MGIAFIFGLGVGLVVVLVVAQVRKHKQRGDWNAEEILRREG